MVCGGHSILVKLIQDEEQSHVEVRPLGLASSSFPPFSPLHSPSALLTHLPPEQKFPICIMLWLRTAQGNSHLPPGLSPPWDVQPGRHGGETTPMPFPFSEGWS